MISLEKWLILTHLQKLPKNVGDLENLIVAKGFKKCPKSNKSSNQVTLLPPSLSLSFYLFLSLSFSTLTSLVSTYLRLTNLASNLQSS